MNSGSGNRPLVIGLEDSKYNETRYNKVISTVTHISKNKTHKTLFIINFLTILNVYAKNYIQALKLVALMVCNNNNNNNNNISVQN